MRLFTPNELEAIAGDMMLFYGDSGTGKSVTTIQTAPDPIMYIMAEGRDVHKMLLAADRPNVRIRFGYYEGWDDFIDMFAHPSNFEPYKTIVVDSLSHLMAICLSDEILEEGYDALADAKKEKDLAMRVKMSKEGFGTLSGQMLRFTDMATNLTHMGKIVVCLARIESAPKFNRALQGAPVFKGQEYGKHFAGFFDFIGMVERNVEGGRVVYPPLISFESDGSFLAKWTGIMPESGVIRKPLNIEKILQASRGISPRKEA